jgi:hypothetical protein
LGIWFKVKEEVKRQPEEHAGELIPQDIVGKRAIQLNALEARFRSKAFIYMEYFEDWLFTSDAEIGAYNHFGMASSSLKLLRSWFTV